LKHGVEIVTRGAEDALYFEHPEDMEAADYDEGLASGLERSRITRHAP